NGNILCIEHALCLTKMWRRRKAPLDDADRIVKDRDRSRERTMNRAVKLLAAKPRSVEELRERLLDKLWTDSGIVDAVIEKLKEYKYLDDEQFARDVAVSKLRQKRQGKNRLRRAMSPKKLDKDSVDKAIAGDFGNIADYELIDAAIETQPRMNGTGTSGEALTNVH